MTAKEYLSQVRILDAAINASIAECLRLRQIADSIPTLNLDTPKVAGGNADKCGMTAVVQKYIDLESKINAETDAYVDLRDEVRGTIRAVPDPLLRSVLKMRYLSFYTFDRIAVELRYSSRQVIRLHKDALRYIEVPKNKKIS